MSVIVLLAAFVGWDFLKRRQGTEGGARPVTSQDTAVGDPRGPGPAAAERLGAGEAKAEGYRQELAQAADRAGALVGQLRVAMRGFGEEIVSARRVSSPEVERWTEFCHQAIDQATALLEGLTPDDELWDQSREIRDGFDNLRSVLRGLAQPPGIKVRLPADADPKRPPVSYVPSRAARDGWLDTAQFELDVMQRAWERERAEGS